MRSFLVLLALGLSFASARDRDSVSPPTEKGPASSASEIPALENILVKGGWTPTPEMSGRYEVGTILDTSLGDHRITARGCFERAPVVSPYIGAEIVSSMQAGVAVRGGFASAGAEASIVKKVRFGTPTTASLERLYMKASSECLDLLEQVEPNSLKNMYIVQEVLKAEIAEQTCGRVTANGKFVTLGSAEVDVAQACAVETLEPVAIGYRTLPLAEVLPAELRLKVLALSAPPPASIPAPTPQVVGTPPVASGADGVSGDVGEKNSYAGHHFGLYLGALSGVRYQWRFASGRTAVGVRVEGGLVYNFYPPFSSIGGQAALEYETRRSADSVVGGIFSLVFGYPIYMGGGAAVVLGRPTGLRAELGVLGGAYGVAAQANVGWVW